MRGRGLIQGFVKCATQYKYNMMPQKFGNSSLQLCPVPRTMYNSVPCETMQWNTTEV